MAPSAENWLLSCRKASFYFIMNPYKMVPKMKVEFITQPFLKYTSMKNDRFSKNAILLLFRVFLRVFFLLRTHYHFCRSTNCVYRRLTLLWFHTSLKKEKAESKKFCGSTASKEDVILLFARDAWSLPTFLPPSYRVSNAEKKMYATEEKTLQRSHVSN